MVEKECKKATDRVAHLLPAAGNVTKSSLAIDVAGSVQSRFDKTGNDSEMGNPKHVDVVREILEQLRARGAEQRHSKSDRNKRFPQMNVERDGCGLSLEKVAFS